MNRLENLNKLTAIAVLVALGATAFVGSASAAPGGCQGDATTIPDGSYNVCLAYVQSAIGSCSSSTYSNPVSADLGQSEVGGTGAGVYQTDYSRDCPGNSRDTDTTGGWAYSPVGFVSFYVQQYDYDCPACSGSPHGGGTIVFVNSDYVAVAGGQQEASSYGNSRLSTGALFYTPLSIFYVGAENVNGECNVYVGQPVAECPAEAPRVPHVPTSPVLP